MGKQGIKVILATSLIMLWVGVIAGYWWKTLMLAQMARTAASPSLVLATGDRIVPQYALKELWSHDVSNDLSSVHIVEDRVYLFSDSILWCFNQKGKLLWSRAEPSDTGALHPNPQGGVVVTADTLLSSEWHSYSRDGLLLATVKSVGPSQTPTFSNDGLIVADQGEGLLKAFRDNNEVWRFQQQVPPEGYMNYFLVGTDAEGYTLAISAKVLRLFQPNGKVAWETETEEYVSQPVPGIGGEFVLYTHDGERPGMAAVSRNGESLWSLPLPARGHDIPPVVTEQGEMYCGGAGAIVCISGTGIQEWQIVGNWQHCMMLKYCKGLLLAAVEVTDKSTGGSSNHLIAIEPQQGQPIYSTQVERVVGLGGDRNVAVISDGHVQIHQLVQK